MKKVISLLLCAVLVLGTQVLTAFAEPDDPPAAAPSAGLYEYVDGDLPGGEMIEMIKEDEGPWKYVVEYTSGNEFTGKAYYYYDPAYTYDESYPRDTGYTGVFTSPETDHILRIVIREGCSGSGSFDVTDSEGGFPFFFTDTNGGEAAKSGQQGGQDPGPGGDPGPGPEAGPSGEEPQGDPDTEKRPLTDGDFFSGTVGDYTASFTLGGNDYVMAIAGWSNSDPNRNGRPSFDGGGMADINNTYWLYRAICFYTDDGSGQLKLIGDAAGGDEGRDELNAIKDAFGDTLSLNIMASEGPMTEYPAVWEGDSISGWACPRIYELYNGTMEGLWVWEATGTIGGETIHAYSTFLNEARRSLTINAEEYSGSDAVRFINDSLADYVGVENPDGMYIEVWLPRGEINGKIVVPEGVDFPVFLAGLNTDERTTLRGCVEALNGETTVEYIDFISTGEKTDEDNIGFYGPAGGELHFVSFTGYYHAVECIDTFRSGGYNADFTGNHVAIYIDDPDNDNGNNNPQNYTFVDNDIAIQLAAMPRDPEDFVFSRHSFINNGTDIDNGTGCFYKFSYSFFYHGEDADPAYVSGDDSAFRPVVSGSDIGGLRPIVACPLARDAEFSGYFIPSEDAFMLNSDAAIEEDLLDGSVFEVVENDGTTVGEWNFAGDGE